MQIIIKNIMLCLFFSLITLTAFSQGKLIVDISTLNHPVYAIVPVNGTYVAQNNKALNPKEGKSFEVLIEDDEPGFIYLFYKFNLIPIYYKPGMWSKIKFVEEYQYKFSGNFRKENEWINKWPRMYNSYSPSKEKRLTEHLKNNPIEAYFSSWRSRLEDQYNDLSKACGKCDPIFLEMVRKELKYYNSNLFSQSVGLDTENFVLWRNMDEYSAEDSVKFYNSVEKWGSAWDSVFNFVSFEPVLAYSSEYPSFIRSYYQLYRIGLNKEYVRKDFIRDETKILHLVKKEQSREIYETYANWYFDFILGGGSKFSRTFLDEFHAFKDEYPESNYLPVLERRMKPVIDYFTTSNKPIEGIVVYPTENYSKLNDLLKEFSGKVVFVDLWATWCGPCINEFSYKEELLEFIKGKDIELLYVSVDKPDDIEKWEQFRNRFKLKGNHIRASENLLEDIWNLIKDEGKKGYPRYVIVAPDGTIAVKNAFRPSSGTDLYNQLTEILNE
jgi:thiol-disulfide isomerase/thioredoxin